MLLLETGDAAGAETNAVRATEGDPGLESAYDLLVQIRLQSGDVEGALAAAQAQATHCGATQDGQLQIARLLVQANRPEEALRAVHSVNDGGARRPRRAS